MAGKGQLQILGFNAAAVVDDTDELRTALFEIDFNASGARVDRVFEQLLDDAGRTFDDFTGGDLGDDGMRQLVDARYDGNFSSPLSCRIMANHSATD